MNTNKQINIMVLVVFLAVFATGAYTIWDPERASSAKDKQLEATIDRGAWLFSQNCRVCHGNEGEGGGASNRLRAAPALNRPDLQGRPAEGEPVDKTSKNQQYKLVFDTITCGRVGKAMPTWAQSQGGPLNEEQIKQLATFIVEGTEWERAGEYGVEGFLEFDHHSPDTADNIRLVAAIGEGDTTFQVTPVKAANKGARLQIDDEIMVVTDAEKVDNGVTIGTVTVERGIGTTDAAEHAADSHVLKPPVPPDPAPVTQAACGQNLPAPVPTPGAAEPPSTTLAIIAQGTAWDKTTLSAIAGQPLTLTLDNRDTGTAHNIHFTEGADPGGDDVVATEITPGPATETLNFGPLEAGQYYYVCDVHLNMEGVLTAVEAAADGAATATP